jgi:hypothetical protein
MAKDKIFNIIYSSGLLVYCTVVRKIDGYFLDANDGIFKPLADCIFPYLLMPAGSQIGTYSVTENRFEWDDGIYTVVAQKYLVTPDRLNDAILGGTDVKCLNDDILNLLDYMISPLPPTPPISVSACRVYEYCFKQDGLTPMDATDIVGNNVARIMELPYDYNGKIHQGTVVEGTYDETTGLLFWDIVQGCQVEFYVAGLYPKQIHIVPLNQTTVRLSDMTE